MGIYKDALKELVQAKIAHEQACEAFGKTLPRLSMHELSFGTTSTKLEIRRSPETEAIDAAVAQLNEAWAYATALFDRSP